MTLKEANRELLRWCRANSFVEVTSFNNSVLSQNEYIYYREGQLNIKMKVVDDSDRSNHYCIFDFYEGYVIVENYDVLNGNTTPVRDREITDKPYINKIRAILAKLDSSLTKFPNIEDIDEEDDPSDNAHINRMMKFFDRLVGCNIATIMYNDEDDFYNIKSKKENFVRVTYKSNSNKSRKTNMPDNYILEIRKRNYDGSWLYFLNTGEFRVKKYGEFSLNNTIIRTEKNFEDSIREMINYLNKTEDEEYHTLADSLKLALE